MALMQYFHTINMAVFTSGSRTLAALLHLLHQAEYFSTI